MLLIDAGNTRIKWQCRIAGVRFGGAAETIDALVLQLAQFDGANQSVVVASVRGPEATEAILQALPRSSAAPVLCKTSPEFDGLKNAYRDYQRLGVDRWLAIIGARHHISKGDILVVDVGTALTLDYVDADNRHCGGYIVPGFETLVRSLNQHTQQISVSAEPGCLVDGFGVSTDEAVNHGCRRMLKAFVEQVVAEYPTATKVFTGGGVAALGLDFSANTLFLSDLVFDGMLCYAASR